jgi:hypothetical protein
MPKGEDEPQERGFKVQDRRRFVDAEGGESAAAEDRPAAADERSEAAESSQFTTRPVPDADAERAELGEMTFSTFVMGLTTQALMHLGEIVDPAVPHAPRDLPAAKQMIDLLGILRDKTKGNLDAGEEQLLGSMLYDLRMRYVEVSRQR